VFQFSRPNSTEIKDAIAEVRGSMHSRSRLLSLENGFKGRSLPISFAHDQMRSRIGVGDRDFDTARQAFMCWAEFDLGWARVSNPEIAIVAGEIVAVEVHAFGLWSLNLSRILETVDTGDRFGFLYATTNHHAEQGEERFLLEHDRVDGAVWYHLEAVSRPRHPLARLAYPFTRALQHQFARDSHRRMERVAIACQP
jgi:uncharacterized protein (UPF0548 family)